MFVELVALFLVGFNAIEMYLRFRQYKLYALTEVPAAIRALIDLPKEKFIKSQQYNAAKSRFAFVSGAFELALSLAVLFFGVMPFVWQQALHVGSRLFGVDESNEIVRSLVYLVIFEGVSTVLHVPFSLYSTFVIEERFGFNKTTLRLFVVDLVKSAALQICLGLPAVAGLLAVLTWAGDSVAFFAWLFAFVLMVLFMLLFPFIQSLFNKFTDLPAGELRTKIEALAVRVNFPLQNILVIDASARSAHGNAYFFGFTVLRNLRIVVYDTLLKQVDTADGVLAIVGHELGHYHHGHTWLNQVVLQAYLLTFFKLFEVATTHEALFRSFGFDDTQPKLIGLLIFSMLATPMSQLFGFGMHVLSRRFEFQADEFALNLGLELEAPLKKIYEENASALIVDPLWSTYSYSHPTLVERLQAMQKLRQKKK
jgi:STE24 endopeptidase